MALTDSNGGGLSAADVAAVVGNGGWGFGNGSGDWWVILFLFAMMGGYGGFGGFGGGYGNMMLGYDFPWLLNGQNGINANTNAGFDHAATQNAINSLQNSVTSGFGDVQTALCGGFAGVNQNICQTGNNVVNAVTGAQNAISQQMYGNQIADLERSFASQTATTNGLQNVSTQIAQGFSDNRLASCQTQNVIQSEAASNRYANAINTRDIVDTINNKVQSISDKLCQLELDGVKAQVEAKNDIIAQLRSEVLYARGQDSQNVQTATILQGQNNEIDALYNRLKSCPVNSVPVFGNQPIFTCPNSINSCGCGSF